MKIQHPNDRSGISSFTSLLLSLRFQLSCMYAVIQSKRVQGTSGSESLIHVLLQNVRMRRRLANSFTRNSNLGTTMKVYRRQADNLSTGSFMTPETDQKWCIIMGNPVEGLEVYGPSI